MEGRVWGERGDAEDIIRRRKNQDVVVTEMREEGRKGVEYATQVSGVDNKAGCLLRRAPKVGEGEGSGFWGKG